MKKHIEDLQDILRLPTTYNSASVIKLPPEVELERWWLATVEACKKRADASEILRRLRVLQDSHVGKGSFFSVVTDEEGVPFLMWYVLARPDAFLLKEQVSMALSY